MATLIRFNDGDETEGQVKCESCEVIYTVIWHRNPIYDCFEYCPFCGEEIEEWVEPETADDK